MTVIFTLPTYFQGTLQRRYHGCSPCLRRERFRSSSTLTLGHHFVRLHAFSYIHCHIPTDTPSSPPAHTPSDPPFHPPSNFPSSHTLFSYSLSGLGGDTTTSPERTVPSLTELMNSMGLKKLQTQHSNIKSGMTCYVCHPSHILYMSPSAINGMT